MNSQKLGSSGVTECEVWIGNCKVWKSTEHKLHKIWRSVKFQQNEHTPAEAHSQIVICLMNITVPVKDQRYRLSTLRWRWRNRSRWAWMSLYFRQNVEVRTNLFLFCDLKLRFVNNFYLFLNIAMLLLFLNLKLLLSSKGRNASQDRICQPSTGVIQFKVLTTLPIPSSWI